MPRKQIVLLALLFAPAAAFAGGSAGYPGSDRAAYSDTFELTPTFSYNFGGTIPGDSTVLSNFDLHAKDGEAYGLTFDIPLSPWVQLELLASRQKTELELDGGIFDDGTLGVADFRVSYYQVGGLFQWGSGQIHPYIVASLGIANLDPNIQGARAENRFAGSVGAGVKIFFSDNFGLRLEGRGFWTALDSNNGDGWDNCHHCDNGSGNTFDQGQASAGLIFAW